MRSVGQYEWKILHILKKKLKQRNYSENNKICKFNDILNQTHCKNRGNITQTALLCTRTYSYNVLKLSRAFYSKTVPFSSQNISLNKNTCNMPRFQRTCSNPFHEMWSKREDEKIVNLRARGLVSLGTIFEKYIEQETGKESTPGHGIKNLCKTCLNECFKKRKFSKLLSNNQAGELKIKVEGQVCRNTEMLQFNFW